MQATIFKTIFFVFFALASQCLLSQTAEITGTVTDSLDKPIPLATVAVEQSRFSAISNEQGQFQLTGVPTGNQKLVVILIGYKTQVFPITLLPGQSTTVHLHLSPSVKTLTEVKINGVIAISGMGHLDELHEGVIYSGKKTEVILLDSLDANTAQNNPRQVLGRVPGANYSETEGGGFPSNGIGFRGLKPTQSLETNTRQNGYNVASDIYGYPEAYYLPPLEAVERIEVTRGASSLQFGPQFGGVINYIVKHGPAGKPVEFTTQQTGGSWGLFNSFYSLGGTVKKFTYYSFLQYKQTDGWRPNSQLHQVSGFAALDYAVNSKLKVGLEYSALRNTIHMPGGLSDAQFAADPQQSFRSRNWLNSPWNIVAFKTRYLVTDNTTVLLSSTLNLSSRNLVWKNEEGGPQRPDSISPVTNTYVSREVQRESFKSSTTELRVLSTYTIRKQSQTLAAGVRYFHGTMNRQGGGPGSTGSDFDLNLYGGSYGYDLQFTTTNLAPFVENTFRFSSRLSITPGFRYEYLKSDAKGYITDGAVQVNSNRSQTRQIPLAGIGLQFKTSAGTNIYANCSQAYKPTDYSNQTPVGVASRIDPHLQDASGYNADLGWRGTYKNFLNFDVGAFFLAYHNRIGLVTLTDSAGSPYTYRTNVANSVHQGIESYVEFNPVKMFCSSSPYGTVSIFESFALIDARYVSGPFKGNQVEFAPRTISRLGVTYSIRWFSTTFLISNTSKAFADANNTVASEDATVGLIPAYQVMDWSASVRVKRYNLKFGVNNLADLRYFTLRTDEYPGPGIIPSAGRSFYIGIGARF